MFSDLTSASIELKLPEATRPSMDQVLERYELALVQAGAKVTRTDSDELTFEADLHKSANFNIRGVDIGLVTRGTLVVEPSAKGYRVSIRGKPRNWLLIAGILPWLAIPWAVGVAPEPWTWLLALGGMPLLVGLWGTVWGNLHAFIDKPGRSLENPEVPTLIGGGADAVQE